MEQSNPELQWLDDILANKAERLPDPFSIDAKKREQLADYMNQFAQAFLLNLFDNPCEYLFSVFENTNQIAVSTKDREDYAIPILAGLTKARGMELAIRYGQGSTRDLIEALIAEGQKMRLPVEGVQ